MYLFILDSDERAEALQFNTNVDGWDLPIGFALDPNHAKLFNGAAVNPITVYTGPYAGDFVLPTALLGNPDFGPMANFLGALITRDVDPADLQNPDDQ